MTDCHIDGSVEGYGGEGGFGEVRDGSFGDIKERVYVRVEDVAPLLRRELCDVRYCILCGVVEDAILYSAASGEEDKRQKDAHGVKLAAMELEMLLDELLTSFFAAQVGDESIDLSFSTRLLLDSVDQVLEILFLFICALDGQVCALEC